MIGQRRLDCSPCARHNIEWANVLPTIDSNPRFLASDIDGVAERKGKFLFMEWKPEGKALGAGQKQLLWQLSRNPNCSVIIIWGDQATSQAMYFQRLGVDEDIQYGGLQRAYLEWYYWADGDGDDSLWGQA